MSGAAQPRSPAKVRPRSGRARPGVLSLPRIRSGSRSHLNSTAALPSSLRAVAGPPPGGSSKSLEEMDLGRWVRGPSRRGSGPGRSFPSDCRRRRQCIGVARGLPQRPGARSGAAGKKKTRRGHHPSGLFPATRGPLRARAYFPPRPPSAKSVPPPRGARESLASVLTVVTWDRCTAGSRSSARWQASAVRRRSDGVPTAPSARVRARASAHPAAAAPVRRRRRRPSPLPRRPPGPPRRRPRAGPRTAARRSRSAH